MHFATSYFHFSCSLKPESCKVPVKQFFFNIHWSNISSFFHKNNYYITKLVPTISQRNFKSCFSLNVQTFSFRNIFRFKICLSTKSRTILRVSPYVVCSKFIILKRALTSFCSKLRRFWARCHRRIIVRIIESGVFTGVSPWQRGTRGIRCSAIPVTIATTILGDLGFWFNCCTYARYSQFEIILFIHSGLDVVFILIRHLRNLDQSTCNCLA